MQKKGSERSKEKIKASFWFAGLFFSVERAEFFMLKMHKEDDN